jgi:hypothetical protein
MFNTAGYDVVFEISRFVLQQAVYTAPVDVGPNNQVLQTFTPPFELSRMGTVDGTTVSLNFIVEMVLQQALANDFKSRDVSASNFGLRILASGDSSSPSTLTAVPDISWIDNDTLGVFGYYRQGASGGNAASKADSDLDKKDFLSVAALIGADGFHRAIAGPTVVRMARDRV